MKSTRASCISLLLICLFFVTAAFVQGQEQNASDKSAIGYLHTRDKVVKISRGEKGTIYTVKSKDGKVLALNLNESDFKQKHPVLFNQVKYGLAGNDASLRQSPQSVPAAPR